MKIWIVTIGEPTLLDSKNPRLLRSAILANKLTEKEVDVTFFNSTFDHTQKKHRFYNGFCSFLKFFTVKSLVFSLFCIFTIKPMVFQSV